MCCVFCSDLTSCPSSICLLLQHPINLFLEPFLVVRDIHVTRRLMDQTAHIIDRVYKLEQLTNVISDRRRVWVHLSQILLIYLAYTFKAFSFSFIVCESSGFMPSGGLEEKDCMWHFYSLQYTSLRIGTLDPPKHKTILIRAHHTCIKPRPQVDSSFFFYYFQTCSCPIQFEH